MPRRCMGAWRRDARRDAAVLLSKPNLKAMLPAAAAAWRARGADSATAKDEDVEDETGLVSAATAMNVKPVEDETGLMSAATAMNVKPVEDESLPVVLPACADATRF